MNISTKQLHRRQSRVRAKVNGVTERPRLAVTLTNRNVTAQVIDDSKGNTLAYVTTARRDIKGTMSQKAAAVGSELGKLAKSRKITKVVFDRRGKLYHGRLHALAEAARQAGLEF